MSKYSFALKNRHDAFGERFESIRQDIGHEIESIGGFAFEPVRNIFSDLLHRAHDHPMSAAARKRPH